MNFITQPFTSDLWQKGIDMFSHNILSKFISTDILYKDFIWDIKKKNPFYALLIFLKHLLNADKT